MPKERKGDPFVTVRLEPHVLERLKEKAGSVKGKYGGAAHHIRKLVYADLGLGEPPTNREHLSERSGKRKTPELDEAAIGRLHALLAQASSDDISKIRIELRREISRAESAGESDKASAARRALATFDEVERRRRCQ